MLIPKEQSAFPYGGSAPIAKVFVGVCDDGTVTFSAVRYSDSPLSSASHVLTEEERERASLLASVARTRKLVRDYGFSNKFEYWASFTFPKEMWDDEKAVSKFIAWMRNHAYYIKQKITYLIVVVPNEKDGWHIHALLSGISRKELYAIRPDMKDITTDQRSRVCQGMTIFKWSRFDEKFGTHHELVRIGSPDKNARPVEQSGKTLYMVRQYDKFLPEEIKRVKRRVYHSKGLKKPEVQTSYVQDDDLLDLLNHCGVTPGKFGTSFIVNGIAADDMLEYLYHLPSYTEDDKDELMPT